MTALPVDLTAHFAATEPAMPPFAPVLVPVDNPPQDHPLDLLAALAAEQRARVLSIVDTVADIASGDLAIGAEVAGLANALTVIVRAAATVGFGAVGSDPQAALFAAIWTTATGDTDTVLNLIDQAVSCPSHPAIDALTAYSPEVTRHA